jgi:hypothetical protein
MRVYARQKIVYSLPYVHTDELILPPDPTRWWLPREGAATTVEVVGVDKFSEEFLALAEQCGWKYCELDGRFYPL